jgi:hypothetical protein
LAGHLHIEKVIIRDSKNRFREVAMILASHKRETFEKQGTDNDLNSRKRAA